MVLKAAARIGWIDEFKGFVLLLVCLYHVEQTFPTTHMGTLHLSALRMSTFFFISGMLFSTRRFNNFKDYFVHKTKVLLLPYICLSLLFLAIDPVVYNFDLFPKTPRMTIMNIRPEITSVWDYLYWNLAKIFVAGKSSIGSGPLWFVFTLYSVSLIFYGVQALANALSQVLNRRPQNKSGVTSCYFLLRWLFLIHSVLWTSGISSSRRSVCGSVVLSSTSAGVPWFTIRPSCIMKIRSET